MILAKELTKSYRKNTVLRGLSFAAEPGEVTLLIGSNGAGKTTTLGILAGLLRPDGGGAFICGKSIVHDRRGAQCNLSFLPQRVSFHPRLSCRDILRFYARLRRIDPGRIEEVLRMTGLQMEAKKRTAALSGGLRQRLGLAVLLLLDTPVLLLDEPGLSLDPEWRARLQRILQDQASRGKTVLVTTHLLGEWEGVADRCLLCREGQIAEEIDPHKLREAFSVAHELEEIFV